MLRRNLKGLVAPPRITLATGKREPNAPKGEAAQATKIRGQGVSLDADVGDDTNDPKWQMVALEGEYRGYGGGARPFAFDRATFDKIVENFHAHPSYSAGTDGVGQNAVIAWDFHHASETEPTEGSIPFTGAPAQGWVHELEVRNGADGKAQLWALTKWLPTAREYVKAGAYKWASVSVVFNAVDAVSGHEVGPVLTSIALTNQPFIEGMQELVAANTRAARLGYTGGGWYGDLDDPEDVVEALRSIFGLEATAGAPEVLATIETLRQQIISGTVPLGVDADDLVGAMRQVLNLRTLSTTDEVFAEVDQLISRLLETLGVGGSPEPSPPMAPQPPAPPAPQPPPAPAATASKPQGNDDMDLIKILADLLGVKESQEAVTAAVTTLAKMRAKVSGALGLDPYVNDSVILSRIEGPNGLIQLAAQRNAFSDAIRLAAAPLPKEEVVKITAARTDADRVSAASSLREKLTQIFKAANVDNPEQRVEDLARMATGYAQLAEVMPELDELRNTETQRSEEEMSQDIAAAMKRQGYKLDAKTSKPLTEAGRIVLEGLQVQHKALGHEKFCKAFELDVHPDDKRMLTSRLTGTKSVPGTERQTQAPEGTIDLAAVEGVNDGDRLNNWVKLNVPGADKWDHERVCLHAHKLRKEKQIVNTAHASN